MNLKPWKGIQCIAALVIVVQIYRIIYAVIVPDVQIDLSLALQFIWLGLAVGIVLPYYMMNLTSGMLLAKGVEAGATAAHLSPRERIKSRIDHWQRNPPYEKYNRTRRMTKRRKLKRDCLGVFVGLLVIIVYQAIWTVVTHRPPASHQPDILWGMSVPQIGERMGYLVGGTFILRAVIGILFHGCGLYIWNTQPVDDDEIDEDDEGTGDPEFEPSYVDWVPDSDDDIEYELPEDPTQPLRELYAKNKISMPEFERRMEKVLERHDDLIYRSANDSDEFSFPDPELEELLEDRD